ncbi:bifunctional DNA-formamidopyrimidine glycosylase/DNA-(apurinic or apyrimidinic site) lyase [Teredinibacter franksiae]|uniref:bifunctional DNA-formamidopyrimidine glycosylase/DNA-(apurinic or apyrimidinic site) lyase n=1 Tax=Teredinibacter franksiae TaxID=2761453 RepID=UPI00162599FE|nr:bifunctional DNA-formamidopyrimidine glycosylase/DNA-(apurinic or apyrimidinic site) lyase [Teredinibacter franksiae]
MPELPEVETTRRGISPHLLGQTIRSLTVRNPNLRWPIPQELSGLCKGKTINAIDRRGKYLLLHLSSGACLIWHLGMSGSMRILTGSTTPEKHDHVDLTLTNGRCLRFHDPRRFGALLYTYDTPDTHPLLSHLGPEPLSSHFDADYLYQRTRKRSQPIKALIMDSKVVVGVGNIYANEALFAASIHPLKAAGKVSRAAVEQLCLEIKQVLKEAIAQGGTTLKDFTDSEGKPGYFAQKLKVYGRAGQPCSQCGKPLTEKRLAQRATIYCTQCQR